MKVPDLGGLPGWASLAIAILAGLNSLRKVRIDERGGVVGELNQLIETLKEEITRVNERTKQRETELRMEIDSLKQALVVTQSDCQKQIAVLQVQLADQRETTLRQAGAITQLERRRKPRPETEP